MSDPSRFRKNLSLRSEKAMGLEAVRRPAGRGADPHPNPLPEYQERERERTVPTKPAAPRTANVTLSSGRGSTGAPPAAAIETAPRVIPAHLLTKEPFTAPLLAAEQKRAALEAMDQNEVKGCTRCALCQGRTNTVFGEGSVDAQLMFIGEGPGETEDQTGRPFVGRAGELLDKQIGAMGLKREDVFIANIVKCRPPGNRQPAPEETAACTPYLLRQIEIIRPKVIVTLGLPATQYMLQLSQAMGKMRGIWHTWRGIKLMPTYHPAYLLRSYTTETRRAVWSDLQQVMAELGLPLKKGMGA